MDGLAGYAYVSVFLAHAADGRLDENELVTIRRNVHRAGRSLGYGAQDIEVTLLTVIDAYWNTLADGGPSAAVQHYHHALESVARAFSNAPDVIDRIQRDLREVAEADGEFTDMEQMLIRNLRRQVVG